MTFEEKCAVAEQTHTSKIKAGKQSGTPPMDVFSRLDDLEAKCDCDCDDVYGRLPAIIPDVMKGDDTPIEWLRELADGEIDLVASKNRDYSPNASFFGNFERVAEILKLYPNLNPQKLGRVAVNVVYMLKQFDAVLWNLSNESEPKIDTLEEKVGDIVNYLHFIVLMKRGIA